MYAYLEGKVAEITPTYVIIDCGGVGYWVNISLNTYTEIKELSKLKLWIQQIVREDAHILYGFYHIQEKSLFNHLMSVSGVGANTARLILSDLSYNEIANCILNSDHKRIQGVKGIGLKTAQRIILDLKDKLAKENFGDLDSRTNHSLENAPRSEAYSALIMLGFNKALVEKALENIDAMHQNLSSESYIKLALKML